MTLCHAALAVDPNCCCTVHATPSCSDGSCSGIVCQIDPYCCSQVWDNSCAAEAAQYCGFASPYCIDGNQNGTFDVCESGGGGPADCDGDGTPDINETGVAGTSQWLGATDGFGIPFEDAASWSYGRPGTATSALFALPYTQYYSYLQLLMGCDNAVRTIDVVDYGTSVLHDLELNLGGRTLRVAGAYSGFRFTPYLYGTFRATVASGNIMATDAGLYLVDDGALQVKFDSVSVDGGPFGWSSTAASVSPQLVLSDSTFNVTSFAWPPPLQGSPVYPTLTMQVSTLQLLANQAGASVLTVPNSATLRVTSSGQFEASTITGSGLSVYTDAGSIVDLQGTLSIDGSLSVGGGLQGRSHCLAGSYGCAPGRLTTKGLAYPGSSSASITWGIDLSGTSGTTPDGAASIRSLTYASIDGTLLVNDLSNGHPPLLGFSVPLVRSATYLSGHDNFDLVRVWGLDQTPLPVGYYVTTERVGDTISVVIKRANPIASTSPVAAPVSGSPSKIAVIDDGSHFGLPVVAYATPGVQGGTQITLRKVNASQGSLMAFSTLLAPADLTDMIGADVNGDGVPELVASFGALRQVRAYSVGPSLTLIWSCQLPAGVTPRCLCSLPPTGASLLPTSPTVGVGTSSGSKGGIGTIGGGTFSVAGEIAIVPNTVNGTDIDNDDDSDIVAGGESSGAALMGTGTGAVQVIRREANGGFTPLTAVSTGGIPNAIAIGDLDGDGYKDVVASCGQITGAFPTGGRPTGVVLRGSAPAVGAGAPLRTPVALDVGSSYAQGTGVSLVDSDGDGNLDIVLSWQNGAASSGGATVIPVREQRASGGLTLGSQLDFAYTGVSQLRRLGPASVLTLRPPVTALTGSSEIVQDDFAAAPVQGDLDGDGFVTNADVALLLLDFGPCAGVPCPSDLDGTGEVDTGDLAYMLLLFQ